MSLTGRQLVTRQVRKERAARLAHRRRLWAYEDAKRGYKPRGGRKAVTLKDDLVNAGLVLALTIFLVYVV